MGTEATAVGKAVVEATAAVAMVAVATVEAMVAVVAVATELEAVCDLYIRDHV